LVKASVARCENMLNNSLLLDSYLAVRESHTVDTGNDKMSVV